MSAAGGSQSTYYVWLILLVHHGATTADHATTTSCCLALSHLPRRAPLHGLLGALSTLTLRDTLGRLALHRALLASDAGLLRRALLGGGLHMLLVELLKRLDISRILLRTLGVTTTSVGAEQDEALENGAIGETTNEALQNCHTLGMSLLGTVASKLALLQLGKNALRAGSAATSTLVLGTVPLYAVSSTLLGTLHLVATDINLALRALTLHGSHFGLNAVKRSSYTLS